jgi:hypothetical protein
MVVKEFHASLIALEKFLDKTNLPQRLVSFATSLNGRSGRLTHDEITTRIDPSIDSLQAMLIEFEEETGFPLDGSPFLETIGLEQALSISTWEEIRVKFRSDDVRAVIVEVGELSTLIAHTKPNIEQATRLLRSLGVNGTGEFYKRDDQHILVTLKFNDESDQISDLSSEIATLKKHLELLARIDKAPEAKIIKVLSASKASPLHIDLIVYASVGMAINKVVHGLLVNVGKIQDIRKQQQEIRSLKLANDREEAILRQLKDEESDYNDPSVIAAEEIMKATDANKIDGSEAEVNKAVLVACKYLVKLFDQGSEVRVYITAKNLANDKPNNQSTKRQLIQERTAANKAIKSIQRKRIGKGKSS